MAIRYKKKQITLCFDKENKVEKYVAANVLVGNIGYKKLCDEVCQRTGMHRGVVDVILKGVQDAMISFMEEGFSVKLDEFGAFRPSINAKGQDSADDVNAYTIIRKKIIFTPGSKFKSMLMDAGVELFENGTRIEDKGNKGDGGSSDDEAPDPEL